MKFVRIDIFQQIQSFNILRIIHGVRYNFTNFGGSETEKNLMIILFYFLVQRLESKFTIIMPSYWLFCLVEREKFLPIIWSSMEQ